MTSVCAWSLVRAVLLTKPTANREASADKAMATDKGLAPMAATSHDVGLPLQ